MVDLVVETASACTVIDTTALSVKCQPSLDDKIALSLADLLPAPLAPGAWVAGHSRAVGAAVFHRDQLRPPDSRQKRIKKVTFDEVTAVVSPAMAAAVVKPAMADHGSKKKVTFGDVTAVVSPPMAERVLIILACWLGS